MLAFTGPDEQNHRLMLAPTGVSSISEAELLTEPNAHSVLMLRVACLARCCVVAPVSRVMLRKNKELTVACNGAEPWIRIQIELNYKCFMTLPSHTHTTTPTPCCLHAQSRRTLISPWKESRIHSAHKTHCMVFQTKASLSQPRRSRMLNGSLATRAKVCLASPQHRHDGAVLKQGNS